MVSKPLDKCRSFRNERLFPMAGVFLKQILNYRWFEHLFHFWSTCERKKASSLAINNPSKDRLTISLSCVTSHASTHLFRESCHFAWLQYIWLIDWSWFDTVLLCSMSILVHISHWNTHFKTEIFLHSMPFVCQMFWHFEKPWLRNFERFTSFRDGLCSMWDGDGVSLMSVWIKHEVHVIVKINDT